MKQLITVTLLLVLSWGLTGCTLFNTKPDDSNIIVQYRTIVPAPPVELYDIPAYVQDIDVLKSTQKDVAEWITKNYGRQIELEEKLLKLHDYQKQLEKKNKNRSDALKTTEKIENPPKDEDKPKLKLFPWK